MLNLAQSPHLDRQRSSRDMHVSAACGLLLGILCVILQERDAATAMATGSAAEAVTAVSETENGAITTAAGLMSDASPAALAAAQRTVSENAAHQTFLAQRQAAREDVTEVQEAWLLRRLGTAPGALKLQSQQWQQGQFTWEGVATQSSDIDSMLQALNRFPRWQQVPVLVQIQSPPAAQGAGPHPGLAFQLQGKLQVGQGAGL